MKRNVKAFLVILAALMSICGMSALAADNTDIDKTFQTAFDNYETKVDISAYNMQPQAAMAEFLDYVSSTPRNFFVESNVNCSYSQNTGFATKLTITYKYDQTTANAMLAAFDAEADKALAAVNDTMTAKEKAMAIHDYLIASCTYDTTYSHRTAYDALVNKTGVCQAYSGAYMYLMNKLGIKCTTVASDAMSHMWNMVEIDGVMYHVDVTWDDPIINGDVTNTVPYYNNFLKTDSEIAVDHYAWN